MPFSPLEQELQKRTEALFAGYASCSTSHGIVACCILAIFFLFPAGALAHDPIYKHLVRFDGTNGSVSNSLIQGTDGNLYGTTQGGTFFKLTPSGTMTILHSFCQQPQCSDGNLPMGSLLLSTDGNFYGVTESGGAHGFGSVFKITPAGELTTFYSFCSKKKCSDGEEPVGAIIQGIDGNFYGTTTKQGEFHYGGTVFKLTPKGKLTTLHRFCTSDPDCLDGIGPISLIQGLDGNLYGVTGSGGDASWGVAFKITPGGVMTTLHTFCESTCDDGATPTGLILAADGNFYGVTSSGGANQFGTAFKLTSDGSLTTFYNFCSLPHCVDGWLPEANFIQGSDANFYGVGTDGGTYQLGSIYELTPAGDVTVLHSFKGKFNGAFPIVPLFQATSGVFYGATSQGAGGGSLFSIDVGMALFVATVQPAAKVGQTIMILGQGLTGTTAVSFNGTSANFTVVSDAYLTAKVPMRATTGSVTVATQTGTLSSNRPFIVMP